jgi:hypothetical protein
VANEPFFIPPFAKCAKDGAPGDGRLLVENKQRQVQLADPHSTSLQGRLSGDDNMKSHDNSKVKVKDKSRSSAFGEG